MNITVGTYSRRKLLQKVESSNSCKIFYVYVFEHRHYSIPIEIMKKEMQRYVLLKMNSMSIGTVNNINQRRSH